MPVPPSGEQFEIVAGEHRATVVEVGGGVRSYHRAGRPVLDPYPLEAMCDGAHGAVLVPWPNRLGDGRYSFDGADYQVALTEPSKHNAIHGFLRWRPWRLLDRSPDRVALIARLRPLPGYPFALDVRVEYTLDAGSGLTATTTATNVGDRDCPYGCGQHPYLSPGTGQIDDARLELAAGTRVVTDEQRQLPTDTVAVAGTPYDFSTARRLGPLAVDHAFGDLRRDGQGRAWVRLTGPDGATVGLWVDASYPYLEIYTGDTLAPPRRRRGLGAEPMTCPPNALATGQDVIRLRPGQSTTSVWGVGLS